MQERLIELQKKILEELRVSAEHGKTGHYGVFPVDVLIRTLRVTSHATPDEIETALNNLSEVQLIQRGIEIEGKEMVSLTDKGREAIKGL